MRVSLIATISLALAFPLPGYTQAPMGGMTSITSASVDPSEIRISRNLDDYFVGYFTPLNEDSGHNFRTCQGSTRFVTESQVRAPEFDVACEAFRPPDFLISKSDLYSQAIGQPLYNLNGQRIGEVGAIVVTMKGEINSYIISSQTGNNYSAVPASSTSAWSSGDSLSFLVGSTVKELATLESLEGDWLTGEVSQTLRAYSALSDVLVDLSTIATDDTLIFDTITVAPPDAWLMLQ